MVEEDCVHRVFAWMLVGVVLVGGYTYYQSHSSQLKAKATQELQEVAPKSAPQDVVPVNTVAGPVVSPLAQFMAPADNSQTTEEEPRRPWKAHPNDHIAPSPVGTSTSIVRKTFAVASSAKFLFEVPAHAASPQFHGTYHSFAKVSGIQSDDENGDVDLLLMNDQQYADFLHGNVPDVVYSVDSSHDQDVSLVLPATMDRPMQYYLVFRNSSARAGKKVVQADFQVDF
jgi:hypothetical protein